MAKRRSKSSSPLPSTPDEAPPPEQADAPDAPDSIAAGAGDAFESNPMAGMPAGEPSGDEIPMAEEIPLAEPLDTMEAPPVSNAFRRNFVDLPSPRTAPVDLSRPQPRAIRGDSFEQNPLSAVRAALPSDLPHHEMDDGARVREALRSVIESGDSVKEAAKEWNVAPSSIQQWRARYQDLLQEDTAKPLIDTDGTPRDAGISHIPSAAQEIFAENWDRLVAQPNRGKRGFQQSPLQIYLETSPLTSWLYQDGYLDRSILIGLLSCVIGVVILGSFLLAGRNAPTVPPPPEPILRDDLAIDEANRVALSFFKAPDWKARLEFVRQPEAVRGMMEAYYADHPDGPINDAVPSMAMPPERKLISLGFDVPSLNRSHFLSLLQSKGHYLVDWESSSFYQEAHLAKLRSERPTGITRIAVLVSRNKDLEYYNYAFSDPGQWQCYQLDYPGQQLNLFGYAARDSNDTSAIDSLLKLVEKQKAVLEVRFPEGSVTDNQVEIVSVLRTEWVPVEP